MVWLRWNVYWLQRLNSQYKEMLGIWTSPSGSRKFQLEKLKVKSREWAAKLKIDSLASCRLLNNGYGFRRRLCPSYKNDYKSTLYWSFLFPIYIIMVITIINELYIYMKCVLTIVQCHSCILHKLIFAFSRESQYSTWSLRREVTVNCSIR